MQRTNTPGTTTNSDNVLLTKNYKSGFFKPSRTIVDCEGITRSERDAIIKLYEALVPKDTTRTINIPMILNEAFPKFEETIGEANFAKLKKYFGIGVKKASKGAMKESEIMAMIGKLRTIENAQYYITGYKDLLEKVAEKLGNAPEAMTMLERAKVVRMFSVIYFGYYYFLEDMTFKRTVNGGIDTGINYDKVLTLNKAMFNPEELFVLWDYKLASFSKGGLIYEIVDMEISSLDKRTRKEVLEFGELKLNPDKGFESVNQTVANQNFGMVRNIKKNVHTEPGVFPFEIFSCKDMFIKVDFNDLYSIYKALRSFDIESFPTHDRELIIYEGSRLVKKAHTCYEIVKDMDVAGPIEAGRFVRLMELAMTMDYNIPIRHNESGEKLPIEDVKFYNARKYMAAIQFANKMEYLDAYTTVEEDFRMAEMFIEMDTSDILPKYLLGEATEDEVKESLGIDEVFERETLGIVREVALDEAVLQYAMEQGYVEEVSDTTMQFITELVIPGNEEIFQEYIEGGIDVETLERKIGFEPEFAEMYFDAGKVDFALLEGKLQDMKRSMADKKKLQRSALTISLYCYVVEGQIPCGPKNKVPKRNKGLKPANLKALIA